MTFIRKGVVLLLSLFSTTSQAKDEVKSGLLLDVVIRQSVAILKLLASEDQTLLIGRDSLLVLNFSLDILYAIAGLDLKSDRLTREGFHKNLHFFTLIF